MRKLTQIARDLFKRDLTRMETATYKVGKIAMYGEFNNKYQYTRHKRPQYFVARKNSHGTWDVRRTIKNSPVTGLHDTVATSLTFEEAFERILREELNMAVLDKKIRTYQQFAQFIKNFSGSRVNICKVAMDNEELAVRTLKKIAGIKNDAPKAQPKTKTAVKGPAWRG